MKQRGPIKMMNLTATFIWQVSCNYALSLLEWPSVGISWTARESIPFSAELDMSFNLLRRNGAPIISFQDLPHSLDYLSYDANTLSCWRLGSNIEPLDTQANANTNVLPRGVQYGEEVCNEIVDSKTVISQILWRQTLRSGRRRGLKTRYNSITKVRIHTELNWAELNWLEISRPQMVYVIKNVNNHVL